MAWSILAGLPNPIIVDAAGTAGSGYVLKAYLPGTTTSTSLAIDSAGSSPQTTITANANGIWEVSGNEITPYIDRKSKWAIFVNATDATANTPAYMGFFDNVEQVASSVNTVKPFPTLAAAVADTTIVDGDVLNLAERTTGNGGGAVWDVVLSSTVTENTFNIVQCTGVGTLSLVLRAGDSAQCKQFGLVDGASSADNTAVIHAAMDYQLSLGGGVVTLGVGDFDHDKITYPGAGLIIDGSNGIASPENYSSNIGTKLSYSGAAGDGIVCFYNGCGIRNTLLIDSLASNATTGLQLEPGPTPGTPLWQTSSYFEIDNVVVRGFLIQVDAVAMSGNSGGWFHRYNNFVFAGRGSGTAGSRGVNLTSNTASMHFGQVRGCEIGIDQGADKNVFDCELSGCATGWITNGGAFSHHIFTTEANTRDLNFNDSAVNRDNHVHLLFSNSGTLDSASVPASNQNTMQFGNVYHGVKTRTATVTQTGTVLLTFNGGVATLVRNETAGMITSVTRLATGQYEFTLRKSVNYISAQAIMMQTNNLRAVIASNTNLRGAGSSNKLEVRIYAFDSTVLTELPAAADQGVLVQISNFQTDITDI